MARTFRRPRSTHPISELNVTNLIDLAFTLLIIFMIATPLIQSEQTIPVNLPIESLRSNQKPPSDTEFQSVSIDRNGAYYLGNRRVSLVELSSALAAYSAKPKQPVIRIRADMTLQWQKVVILMDEIKKHNLTKVTFDTQGPS
jgi:biopolymer transport protein ExbD